MAATQGGHYEPMPIGEAFDVAIKRCVIDKSFRVEVAADGARLTSPWRDSPRDVPQRDAGGAADDAAPARGRWGR